MNCPSLSYASLVPLACLFLAPDAPAQADPTPAQGITWADLLGRGSSLKLYGFVRLDAQYSDSRFNDPQIPFAVLSEDTSPPDGAPGGVLAEPDRSDFTLSARLTRLGLSLAGTQALDADLSGKIEVDFYNIGLNDSDSRNALRMRLAYIDLDWGRWSLRAGQDWDVISPLYPVVNNDLMMWGAGNTGDRRPQLTATYKAPVGDSTFTARFGIALAGAVASSAVQGGLTSGEASGMPLGWARLGYRIPTEKSAFDVGIWGHVSQERFNATGDGEDDFDSHSIGLDATIPVVSDKLWLQGEYWTGQNLRDIRGGILQGVNAATGEEIEATGGFAELGWKASKSMSLYAGYSRDDPHNDDLSSFMRSNNTIPYLAARWSFGDLRLGLEYLNWTTEYIDLDEGRASRVVGWIAYYF